MFLTGVKIPPFHTLSEDETADLPRTRTRSVTRSQLTNNINIEEITCLGKKRKLAHTNPIRQIEKGMQLLEEAKTHLAKNEASLLEQAITLINHALAHTQPEPSPSPSPSPSPLLEEKLATFTTSFNTMSDRLGRVEASLAFIGSQASQSGSTNTERT